MLPEYHKIVFADLDAEVAPLVDTAILGARVAGQAYWSAMADGSPWRGEAAWLLLNTYLGSVEGAMREIVAAHSLYYWIHLYRRIGVMLHPGLLDSRDKVTVHLVRNIMENAFVRYAAFENRDMGFSTKIGIAEVAGGLFLRALERDPDPRDESPRKAVKLYSKVLSESGTWLLRDFSAADYLNVYRLEGLAHEYWLTTARMRRVGKGGSVEVDENGDLWNVHDETFESLIENYDQRIEAGQFDASSIGASFSPVPRRGDVVGLVASYNVSRRPWSQFCLKQDICKDYPDLVTNFLLAPFSMNAYFAAHSFALGAFEKRNGFSLASFCGYLAAVAAVEIANAERASSEAERFVLWKELYQRGYSIHESAPYADRLAAAALGFMDDWQGPGNHRMSADAPLLHEYFTLRPAKRPGAGLWSLGPRYVFIPYDSGIVTDLQALTVILRNAFFGVLDQPGGKGSAFEDGFRDYVVGAGLQLLPERILKSGAGKRECDAAVRVENTLFLCECRAMERPLAFEIGHVPTIERRTSDLKGKVGQVLSLADFVRRVPRGLNYDFLWAQAVVPLVVSPFVEWIWTDDDSLWLDEDVPRVLSAREAVSFMKGDGRHSGLRE